MKRKQCEGEDESGTKCRQNRINDKIRDGRQDSVLKKTKSCTNEIDGLQIIEDFIDQEEQKLLWSNICQESWSKELTRDTLHYGQRYDYKRRTLVNDAKEIPEWLIAVKKQVELRANFENPIDQIIINRYTRGQSISPHIDHKVLFGPTIATLSLGAEVSILFRYGSTSKSVDAPDCSLLVMKGDSRYRWKHSLKLNAVGERISITFRTMNKTV